MSPQEQKQQNLTAIYQALLTLISRKPISLISITELCQAAQVSRTYFYKNFGHFDQIITAFQQQYMLHYLRGLPNTPKITLAQLMTHYFEIIQQDATNNRLLIQNGKSLIFTTTFQTVFTVLIHQDRIQSTNNDLLTAPYYLEYFSGAVVNLAITWLQHDFPEPASYLAQQIVCFAQKGPSD